MLNKTYFISITIATLITLIFPACYAKDISYAEIIIGRIESLKNTPLYEYPADSKTRLMLSTRAIRENERNSQPYRPVYPISNVKIYAMCLSPNSLYRIKNMWPPNKTIICDKGDSVLITNLTLNGLQSNKYEYIGMLTTIRDRDDEIIIKNLHTINDTTQKETEPPINEIRLVTDQPFC